MKILKEMTIGEVVRNYPESVEVLFSFGLGCVGCPSAQAETIEKACGVHGIDVEQLIKELWINGFLSASGTGYRYIRTESSINTIRKV